MGDLKEQFDNLITQDLTFVNFLNDHNQDILNNITPKLFNNFQGSVDSGQQLVGLCGSKWFVFRLRADVRSLKMFVVVIICHIVVIFTKVIFSI